MTNLENLNKTTNYREESGSLITSLSLAEQKYVREGIFSNLRNDGRQRLDFRPLQLETGILDQANGSARLKLGSTDILVGVKAQISTPNEETPNLGSIFYYVETFSSAAKEFNVTKKTGTSEDNELNQVIERILGQSFIINREKLKLQGSNCWVLYVDILVLGNDGNILDSIILAIRAAIHNTKIPNVHFEAGIVAGDYEIVISGDPNDYWTLSIDTIPVLITISKIGKFMIVDANKEEEQCADVQICIAVNSNQSVTSIHKLGKGGLLPSSLQEMIAIAFKITQQLLEEQNNLLKREGKRQRTGFL
eukprot:TRINITY_DN5631_c0_g1_i1.p1 TRINITY_DN5631_c0_g1~~TRINITY_DN5631_c0_g1_i1.p1  ORF type:complete len:307 (-),score=131.54 TRINITY_DN5631_c0_g1_i1:114-1034(-)